MGVFISCFQEEKQRLGASPEGLMVKVGHSQVQFPVMEPHHPSVSCQAVVAAHRKELEGLTTRIYNYILRFWGGGKKERKIGNTCQLKANLSQQIKKKQISSYLGV